MVPGRSGRACRFGLRLLRSRMTRRVLPLLIGTMLVTSWASGCRVFRKSSDTVDCCQGLFEGPPPYVEMSKPPVLIGRAPVQVQQNQVFVPGGSADRGPRLGPPSGAEDLGPGGLPPLPAPQPPSKETTG